MKLVYLSLTDNVRSFVSKTGLNSIELNFNEVSKEVKEDFYVVIPTYDQEIVNLFIQFIEYKGNKKFLKGVIGSGNLNYGTEYCFCAKDIALRFNSPIIMLFELDGTDEDVKYLRGSVNK